MLAGSDHALQHEDLVVLEHVGSLAAHHFDELFRQFERRVLEAQILGRRRQHEAKVDVDDVPFIVQQNVAVVSILDLSSRKRNNPVKTAALAQVPKDGKVFFSK